MTFEKMQEIETPIDHAMQNADYIRTNVKDPIIREEAREAIVMLHHAIESLESDVLAENGIPKYRL